MDKRTTTTVVEEPPIAADDVPGVIAYRVGQLEKAVEVGFRQHNEKLDALINNFATKDDLAVIRKVTIDHAAALTALVATDNKQQGAIDANRRMLTVGLTVLGIIVSAFAIYSGLHK